MKNKYVYLVTFFLLIFCIRFFHLGVGDLVTDEAKTALGIAYPHSFVLPAITELSQKIFGAHTWAVRLPFVFLSFLISIGWFIIGRYWYNRSFGLILAGISALLPTGIIFSRTAFLDTPVTLMWLCGLYAWMKYDEQITDPSPRASFVLWAVLMCAPWIKLQAVYLHMVFAAILLYQTRGRLWHDSRSYLLAFSLVPICLYVLGQPQQMYDIYAYGAHQSNGLRFAGLGNFIGSLILWLGPYVILSRFGWYQLGKYKTTANKRKEFLWFAVGLVALFFSVIGTRQPYYAPLFEIAVVPGVGFALWYLYAQKEKYAYGVASILILWSVGVSWYGTSISPYFCNEHPDRCYWETISGQLKLFQRQFFVDDALGYTPKWIIPAEIKKWLH
jgi:4-amino-4-deoxy-L-arabinose transferase-like glycosyltransferase